MKKKLKVVLVVLLSVILFFLLRPTINKIRIRNTVENFISNSPIKQLFSAIEKYDTKTYNEIIEEMIKVGVKTGMSTEAISSTARKLGTEHSKEYFMMAQNQDVYNFLVKYTEYLDSKLKLSPLTICQLENPKNFGLPNDPILIQVEMKHLGIPELMANIVKSAALNPTEFNEIDAEKYYDTFINNFQKKNMSTLSINSDFENEENIRKFALTYLSFYKDLIQLKQEKSVLIYKYMRQIM